MGLVQWRRSPCSGGSPVIGLHDRRTTLIKGGIDLLERLNDEGSLSCWVEQTTCDLTACAGGRVTLGPFDPIQAPALRTPWLCSVDESVFRCESDLTAGCQGPEICQPP